MPSRKTCSSRLRSNWSRTCLVRFAILGASPSLREERRRSSTSSSVYRWTSRPSCVASTAEESDAYSSAMHRRLHSESTSAFQKKGARTKSSVAVIIFSRRASISPRSSSSALRMCRAALPTRSRDATARGTSARKAVRVAGLARKRHASERRMQSHLVRTMDCRGALGCSSNASWRSVAPSRQRGEAGVDAPTSCASCVATKCSSTPAEEALPLHAASAGSKTVE
mmetsp:Transcript_28178/g.68424  ORF Transcript_28178/g.68424 Transcript_28178/m.68424 type:complete len:226 (+) Transcript_28178:2529-3206(+)